MRKNTTSLLLIFFSIITGAFAQSLDPGYDINPGGAGWADSYQANNLCWCSTTFDHGLNDINVTSFVINGEKRNIEDICDELKNHPSFRALASGDPLYNDIQCGNGPANADYRNDETYCPGIVTNGNAGCSVTGPTWDLAWLASRTRFGGNGSLVSNQIIQNGKYYIESPYLQERIHSDYGIGYTAKMEGENTSGENQVWSFIHLGNNVYSVRNETNYRYLEVNGGQCTNSSNVGTWFKNEDDHQRWKVVANGTYFNLIPEHCTTKALDRSGGGAAGANVVIYNYSTTNNNQNWNLVSTGETVLPPGETIVTIKGETIDSYITYDDAFPHYVRADNGTTNNTFTLENNGDGTYSFKSSTGNYMSSENGQPYVTCNRNTSTPDRWERFELEPLGTTNVYAIKWKSDSGPYLYLSHENNRFPMKCDRESPNSWERFVITEVNQHSSDELAKNLAVTQEVNQPLATFFPSPVTHDEVLSVKVNLSKTATAQVQILDLSGKVFAQKEFPNLEAGTNFITLKELQNSISVTGVYILKLKADNQVVSKTVLFD